MAVTVDVAALLVAARKPKNSSPPGPTGPASVQSACAADDTIVAVEIILHTKSAAFRSRKTDCEPRTTAHANMPSRPTKRKERHNTLIVWQIEGSIGSSLRLRENVRPRRHHHRLRNRDDSLAILR